MMKNPMVLRIDPNRLQDLEGDKVGAQLRDGYEISVIFMHAHPTRGEELVLYLVPVRDPAPAPVPAWVAVVAGVVVAAEVVAACGAAWSAWGW